MKKYIKYGIGGIVGLVLTIAVIATLTAAKADIPDDQVEQIAMDLNLVSIDEADYPSVAEMEERVQNYRAGEAFTNYSVRLGIGLVIAIILITLGLSGLKLAQNKKRLIRFSIPAGGLVLILLISRMTASDSMEGITTAVKVDPSDLITVSTLVNATLILLVISFTALLTYRIKHVITK